MPVSNARIIEQLGMRRSTASARLQRMILFSLVKELNKNVCYRCGKIIDNINDFSIEHKIDWLDSENPLELFFDLNNISFSHAVCNSSAAKKFTGTRDKTPHGLTRYIKGCRCEICVFAMKEKNKKDMENRSDYIHSDEFRKRNAEYQRRRYHSEPEFREKSLQRIRKK
jgi:hypothetical protein